MPGDGHEYSPQEMTGDELAALHAALRAYAARHRVVSGTLPPSCVADFDVTGGHAHVEIKWLPDDGQLSDWDIA